MELRTYFNKKPVEKRLEKTGNKISDYHNGMSTDDRFPSLVYHTQDSIHMELPSFLKGLKCVRISVNEVLELEQNTHIKQGSGKVGETRYEVSYGTDEYPIPSGYAFRSIIRIRIYGIKLQSVLDCYKQVRKGESEGNWKGCPTTPTHCS